MLTHFIMILTMSKDKDFLAFLMVMVENLPPSNALKTCRRYGPFVFVSLIAPGLS